MSLIFFENIQVNYNEYVYEPAEDSCLLTQAALEVCKSGTSILEIGTGSGFISAVILEMLKVNLIATDISSYAVACASANGVPVIHADLFSAFKKGIKFDTIIFNPPYLPTAMEERIPGWLNYAFDGGEDGTSVIKSFLIQVIDYIQLDSQVLLLISSLTGIEKVKELMSQVGFEVAIIRREKCDFEELVVLQGIIKN